MHKKRLTTGTVDGEHGSMWVYSHAAATIAPRVCCDYIAIERLSRV